MNEVNPHDFKNNLFSIGWKFGQYVAPELSNFDRLFDIFKELLIHTSGDFDETIGITYTSFELEKVKFQIELDIENISLLEIFNNFRFLRNFFDFPFVTFVFDFYVDSKEMCNGHNLL